MHKAKVGWQAYLSHLRVASFGSMSMSLNTVQPCTTCSAGWYQQHVVVGVRVCCMQQELAGGLEGGGWGRGGGRGIP